MTLNPYDQNTLAYLQAGGASHEMLRRVEKSLGERSVFWACQATIVGTRPDDGLGAFETTRTLPTFFLDERVQGVLTEDDARHVAKSMVRSVDIHGFWHDVNVSVARVEV